MSKKHKKACRVLNYTDHLLIVVSAITEFTIYNYITVFAYLVGIPMGITSSA